MKHPVADDPVKRRLSSKFDYEDEDDDEGDWLMKKFMRIVARKESFLQNTTITVIEKPVSAQMSLARGKLKFLKGNFMSNGGRECSVKFNNKIKGENYEHGSRKRNGTHRQIQSD